MFIAAVKHYAMTEKGQDEVAADYEAQQVGSHIAHKIYELNKPPNQSKTQRKKTVPQMCEVTNLENTCSNNPKDNNVLNSEKSNSCSSHSMAEASTNGSEKHIPISESLPFDTDNEHEDLTFSDKENDEEESVHSQTINDSDTS